MLLLDYAVFFTRTYTMRRLAAVLPFLLLIDPASASCGSNFCTVNTNWDTQGLDNHSGLMVDVRWSYAQADQWRAGFSKKKTEAPSGSGEEIENKRTVNQILNVNLDYAVNAEWGIMLGLPWVKRDHTHTLDAEAPSDPVRQRASFSEIGDVRVQAKYKLAAGEDSGAGIRFGLKLPSGATGKTMTPSDPNDPAKPYKLERSSQPGSGSTDGILGFYYFRNTPGNAFGWFINAQYQSALATKDAYRPGDETTLDTGIHYEVTDGTNLLLQLNAQYRRRDTGINANAASGGYSLSISPGASYAVDQATQIYGFLQLPIVRYVNTDPADSASGQLAARWAASVGITRKF